MKILFYCQHVLGIGHLHRSLEICKALTGHDVLLVLGGPPIQLIFPDHIRIFQLPGLQMDENFKNLLPVNPDESLEEIKTKRQNLLFKIFKEEQPDIFLVELYPFGRKAFRFELEPILTGIRNGNLFPAKTVCSVRDILVEKKAQKKYENRVLSQLDSFFDAVFVHGDPRIIPLDTTFSATSDITPPVMYTGYVCQFPQPHSGEKLRSQLGLDQNDILIVVSAGGGNVGYQLLKAVLDAQRHIDPAIHLYMFTGPYLDEKRFNRLLDMVSPRTIIRRFTNSFPAWLAAANLSISMAGYNTCMNTLAAATPALVFPFSQNREQRMRAEKLEKLAHLKVLNKEDLEPEKLAGYIQQMLKIKEKNRPQIKLDGAKTTALLLSRLHKKKHE